VKNLKVLIASDGMHAHFFERQGWLNAFNAIPGVQALMYECKKYKAFDVFDTFEPDIFIGQLYNLDDATFKCILERPNLKVALRAGDWGDFQNTFDHSKHPTMLFTTDEDIRNIKSLKEQTGQPSYVFCHYDQEGIEKTHNYFRDILNINIMGLPMGADVFLYGGGKHLPEYECDISFIGGWWHNKAKNIDKCLRPLCYPVGAYNIKVFAWQPWPHLPQYCGNLDNSLAKHVFASSKICPNISEPHSTEFGIDINERSFKTLCAGGFCIYDNVEAAKRLYRDGEEVVFYNDESEFRKIIDYYLVNKDEARLIAANGQKRVFNDHTYFDRANQILEGFGINKKEEIKSTKWKVINDQINNI
jgi:spore maturation protein CgeB